MDLVFKVTPVRHALICVLGPLCASNLIRDEGAIFSHHRRSHSGKYLDLLAIHKTDITSKVICDSPILAVGLGARVRQLRTFSPWLHPTNVSPTSFRKLTTTVRLLRRWED